MKLLVVHDHWLIREALRGALGELADDVVVLEAADSRQALGFAEQHADLDLIVLDHALPDRDGFGLLAELRGRFPTVAVVVLSALDERSNVVRALALGARGFIPKSASRDVTLSALRLVCSGGTYIPLQILQEERPPPLANRRITHAADVGLTERQLDVLVCMMQGTTNKAIGRRLTMAVPTVKNHVTTILKLLGVSNRTQAVVAVRELGWDLPALSGS